jgi:hypothetical protein
MLKNTLFFLAAFFSILLIAGCSMHTEYRFVSSSPTLELSDSSLKELSVRHKEYWELRANKESEKSYLYELPYLRFLHPYQKYETFTASSRKKFKVVQFSITKTDADRAIVKHELILDQQTRAQIDDYWVLVSGKWYHYFEFSKLPAFTTPF